MSDRCSASPPAPDGPHGAYRRVLWVALLVNAAMFAVEVAGSVASSSVSLLADAADFLGDAANYALTLAVLSMGLAWRARAALIKGLSMGIYGAFVLVKAGHVAAAGIPPEPLTMGAIALLAFAANVGVAAMLFAYRGGDANMRSVWLCTRNDCIGNAAVLLAALGVFGTGSIWPDLVVAAVMAVLAITAAKVVIAHSLRELEHARELPVGEHE
jgi:Co/Zn/Cd efflux system component